MQHTSVEDSHPIRIGLFGGLTVVCNGQEITRFRTRKTASLFAYLAFFEGRCHPRDVLMDLFWPESNQDAARQSLRMALSAIRGALGSEAKLTLETDRGIARLSNISTDVAKFELESDSDDFETLAQRIKLVRGTLLAGFDDSWIMAQWLRIEEMYAQATVRLMGLAKDQAEIERAIVIGRHTATLTGVREDVHLGLMKLLAASGRNAAAIAQFEELEKMLDDQWGERPSDEAIRVLNSLESSTVIHRPTPIPRPAISARTSSFVGREDEVAEVIALVKNGPNRLVTLMGMGGMGKTSLASVIAQRFVEDGAHSVWMMEFADVLSPERIVEKILKSVLGDFDQLATISAIAEEIGQRPSIFVLDNLEHLLPEGSVVVRDLLAALPSVRILATSRVRLSIDGEQVFVVPPLAIPSGSMSLGELSRVSSVALFTDRARASRPNFVLGPSNATAIAEICRRLDGLPLAIELAASKVITHSPSQILSKLFSGDEFLQSRRTDIAERQRSLRASLDWSLSLLANQEKEGFLTTSVFRGGFTAEAALEVAGARKFDDFLELLVESSLVVCDTLCDPPRFRLLEPIREFALSSLSPSKAHELRRRHFEYFLKLSKGAGLGAPRAANRVWLDALHTDNENLCCAFESVFDGVASPDEAAELVVTIRPMFLPRGHSAVWRSLILRLMEHIKDRPYLAARAKLSVVYASMSSNMSSAEEVKELFLQAKALCDQTGDIEQLGMVEYGLGGYSKIAGEHAEAIYHFQLAMSAFESVDDDAKLVAATRQLAMTYLSMKDTAQCYSTLKQALPVARRSGDPDALAWTLTDLAVEHSRNGLQGEAEACFKEAHEVCIQTDSSYMRAIVFWEQGDSELRRGLASHAVALLSQSVEHALRADFRELLKRMLVVYACALQADNQAERGVVALAFVLGWREREKRQLTPDESASIDTAKSAALKFLGPDSFDSAWARGTSATLDEVINILKS
ncbi:MAG: tetratricopeptide repeat protein [Armatimonadetes bacterium]|nr:tetratricopeptide repeat protein [Armatimonadota bacterium]